MFLRLAAISASQSKVGIFMSVIIFCMPCMSKSRKGFFAIFMVPSVMLQCSNQI